MKNNQKTLEYAEEQAKKYRAYRRFLRGITSNATKKTYVKFMINFMEFHKITDYDVLAKYDTGKIDVLIEDYIDALDSRGNKAVTIRTNLAGIERFFEMNDCIWHKKRIRRSVKKDVELPGGKQPITTQEIYKMLSCTKSLRTKALVHFLASTGIRPGALVDPVLRYGHLEKIDECYSVQIYDGTIESYWAFLTPEATLALDDYFEKRKLLGETINDESPIFSMLSEKNTKSKYMSEDNVRYVLENLIKTAGIKRKKVSIKRYDKAIVYMFRKRFNTILKLENEVNSNIAEKLMAHKKGLDGTYLQPTREECFAEFAKAIHELTIDPTNRLKVELREGQQMRLELEEKNKKYEEQNDEIAKLREWKKIVDVELAIRKKTNIHTDLAN